VYFWRPSIERGLTREAFENNTCDILLDIPVDFEGLLTTIPIYRTTYVLAFREDSDLKIESLDDPKLKSLKVGVYQTSAMRFVLASHGITNNVAEHVISHDADLVPEHQPWRQVQEVIDGKLDIAAVWGPFAGWLKTMKAAPLTIQAVNLMDDSVPLEFDIAFGMRQTDAVLKYMFDHALDRSKDEIKKILNDYGVPLVQCSRCVVSGNLPSHGSYFDRSVDAWRKQFLEPLPAKQSQLDKSSASSDQIVTQARIDEWLKAGSSLNQELSYAVLSSDSDRVVFLLQKGADVNWRNSEGLAPLHVAARQRDSDMITVLAEHHADVNAPDSDGWTPLLHAVLRNHVPSIQTLLAHGANIEAVAPGGFTPLAIGIEEGKFYAANALIEAGASVNTRVGQDRLSPLMLIASQPQVERRAARRAQGPGSVDIARALIAKGAILDAESQDGATALMIAAAHDNAAMAALFVQSGANMQMKAKNGKTALDIARDNSSDQVIKVLEMFTQSGATVLPSASTNNPTNAQGQ